MRKWKRERQRERKKETYQNASEEKEEKKSIIVKYIASNKLTINDVSDQLKPSIYFEEIEKRLEFDTILQKISHENQ